MTGNNPVDRSKLGTKRHILTDKEGIPLSAAVISSASTHDIKLVTDVIDSTVIKRQSSSSSSVPTLGIRRRRRKLQHLCLDKAYNSEPEEQKLIKRGYILHIHTKEIEAKKRRMSKVKHNLP